LKAINIARNQSKISKKKQENEIKMKQIKQTERAIE